MQLGCQYVRVGGRNHKMLRQRNNNQISVGIHPKHRARGAIPKER
jgi:hypothetical protein